MARSSEIHVEVNGELDAVNDALSAIGESAVNTLDDNVNADVANIRRILNQFNRRSQTRGWTFNTETTTLLPDIFDQHIPFLDDYLSVLSTGGATVYRNRGGYIYDTSTATDRFTGPISVELITLIPYGDMPEVFKQYIVALTAQRFNMSFFGDDGIEAALAEQVMELQIAVMEWDLDYGNHNMLEGDAWVQGRIGR